jgi:hypothetical protein
MREISPREDKNFEDRSFYPDEVVEGEGRAGRLYDFLSEAAPALASTHFATTILALFLAENRQSQITDN